MRGALPLFLALAGCAHAPEVAQGWDCSDVRRDAARSLEAVAFREIAPDGDVLHDDTRWTKVFAGRDDVLVAAALEQGEWWLRFEHNAPAQRTVLMDGDTVVVARFGRSDRHDVDWSTIRAGAEAGRLRLRLDDGPGRPARDIALPAELFARGFALAEQAREAMLAAAGQPATLCRPHEEIILA